MKKNARVDANQQEIVKALREAGATVLHLHQIGGGCPDILVGFQGKNILIEIKDGSKPPSKRLLTQDQQKFHQSWTGQVMVVESVDDALNLLKLN